MVVIFIYKIFLAIIAKYSLTFDQTTNAVADSKIAGLAQTECIIKQNELFDLDVNELEYYSAYFNEKAASNFNKNLETDPYQNMDFSLGTEVDELQRWVLVTLIALCNLSFFANSSKVCYHDRGFFTHDRVFFFSKDLLLF